MVRLLLLFFMLSSLALPSSGQTVQYYNIDWFETSTREFVDGENFETEVNHFSYRVANQDAQKSSHQGPFAPQPTIRLVFTGMERFNFQVSEVKYVPFDSSSVPLYNTTGIGEDRFLDSVVLYTANHQTITEYYFLPFRKNTQTGQFERVTYFKLQYQVSDRQSDAEITPTFAPSSALSSGNWFKIAITKSGIYKIDRNYLQQHGLNIGNIDARTIKIYGLGGEMLPVANSQPRPADIPEVAIYQEGLNDGSMDNGDFIYFYGQGPQIISYQDDKQNDTGTGYRVTPHDYSDTAYYFITFGGELAKTMQALDISATSSTSTNFADVIRHHETEAVNILNSGRHWLGERFGITNTVNIPMALGGELEANSLVKAHIAVANTNTFPVDFSFKLNGQDAMVDLVPSKNLSIPALSGATYASKAIVRTARTSWPSNQLNGSPAASFDITLNSSTANAIGYLDYITLHSREKLNGAMGSFPIGDHTLFNAPIPQTYLVDNAANAKVFHVSDHRNPKEVATSINGTTLRFTLAPADSIQFFAIVSPNTALSPTFIGNIQNQNLKAMSPPDMLIISPSEFITEAERFKQHRQNQDGWDIEIVTPHQIYQEFSSGQQDVTAIRDFVRHLYQKDSDKFNYLFLFGDCSYDYKNGVSSFGNKVPTYQYARSFDEIQSKNADDFFGFLDEDEGAISESASTINSRLDIALGRAPIANLQDAKTVVDKIISYETNPERFGPWRNRLSVVADDGDGAIHMSQTNSLVSELGRDNKAFIAEKIYVAAFPQVISPGGERSPNAQEKLFNSIDEGAFLVNYVGHGSEFLWMDEQILSFDDIKSFENEDKLSIFVTATCDFGKYDDPNNVSGGEQLVLQPRVGAVAGVVTTRPVYSQQNAAINRAFFRAMFNRDNGNWNRLGEVYRQAKNNAMSQNNLGFFLLGDPSLNLALPEHFVRIDSFSGEPFLSVDTVSALQFVTISGHIEDNTGAMLSNFNGRIRLSFFDKESSFQTLVDNHTYSDYVNLIYDGTATVRNGKWKFEFVVPKDINYLMGQGKMSLYAMDTTNGMDAHFGSDRVAVGGTATNVAEDNAPPIIKPFINSRDFSNGGLSGPDPLLIVDFEDQHGISFSGNGVGNNIEAVIDGKTESPIVLNENYISSEGNFREGSLTRQLPTMEPGLHTVCIKASDTYNNRASACIEFTVVSDQDIRTSNLKAVPNPSYDKTTVISFEHNMGDGPMEVEIRLVDLTGRLVWNKDWTFEKAPPMFGLDGPLTIDGLGHINESGLYLAHLYLRSQGKEKTIYTKIIFQ